MNSTWARLQRSARRPVDSLFRRFAVEVLVVGLSVVTGMVDDELENFFADLRRPVFGQRLKSLKIQGLCVSINVKLLIYDDKFSSSGKVIPCRAMVLNKVATVKSPCWRFARRRWRESYPPHHHTDR